MKRSIQNVSAALASVVAFFVSTTVGTEIPPPTGRYHIGRRKYDIPFLNTEDLFAPGNVSTSFIATVWYPTLQEPCEPATPYLDPAVAALWEPAADQTAGTLSNLTSHVQPGAPPAPAPRDGQAGLFPTLLFGPGGTGPPTEAYTILISELVSRGYVVAGLDHPYEQPFVRYPNGTGVYGPPVNYTLSSEEANLLYEMRIKDNVHFVGVWPDLVAELDAPWATAKLGAFGHSIGGAAAAGTARLIARETLASTLNMDGTFLDATNDSATADIHRPTMLLGQDGHDADDGDLSWEIFPAAQTGWWRTMFVNGTAHLDFSDWTFWKTLGGKPLGTIDGARMVDVTREFVTAFFNYTILGQEEGVLTSPGPVWPEVSVYDGSDE
ncbi:Uu.00g142930.m01.CDS01 [Anthostomella pinea]|uniref:1-alkyl-2-acetylglycerophosphocholine esterase n=1 Tax=Anthostomella pinea TaxID=933095 RepID=A0AAI8VRR6_9PEZI|nr:Uu.00g142930.m01.CDS01 [Anthostomella pinea]